MVCKIHVKLGVEGMVPSLLHTIPDSDIAVLYRELDEVFFCIRSFEIPSFCKGSGT